MDEQVIEIRGGIARTWQQTLISEAPMDNVMPLLGRRELLATPILPRGTISISIDPESQLGVVVVETSPSRQTIRIVKSNENDERDTEGQWTVPMPYLYWAIRFSSTNGSINSLTTGITITESQLFWRPTRLRHGNDDLWQAKIPNVGESAVICWGGVPSDIVSRALGERVDELINTFFGSDFNDDLGWNTPAAFDGDFDAWANSSEYEYPDWSDFSGYGDTTLESILAQVATPHNPVTFGPTAPPPVFTVNAARQWARNATTRERRVFLAGIAAAIDEIDNPPAPQDPTLGDEPGAATEGELEPMAF
jgi:hypothetical protein